MTAGPRRAAARRSLTAIVIAAALAGCMPMTTTTGGTPAAGSTVVKDPIAGRYAINGNRADVVIISKLADSRYAIENPGNWTGVGIFDGRIYYGVFRYPDDTKHGSLMRAVGVHRAERQKDGSFKVHGNFSGEGQGLGEFDVEWKRL